jgi:hypothetical protein
MIGEVLENNAGQKYVILERAGKSNAGNIKWKIRFIATGYETVVEKVQMKRGKIKDRYAPDIFGVGYIGNIDAMNHKKEYNVWHKMLQRCYDPISKSFPDYGAKGVSVNPRWHSFENFVKDIPLVDGYDEGQFGIGNLNLDKDLKQQGVEHKIYSLETCTFMTRAENSSLIDREERKHEFTAVSPLGQVYKAKGLNEFCREHDLTKIRVRLCLKGEAKTHKGWTFTY